MALFHVILKTQRAYTGLALKAAAQQIVLCFLDAVLKIVSLFGCGRGNLFALSRSNNFTCQCMCLFICFSKGLKQLPALQVVENTKGTWWCTGMSRLVTALQLLSHWLMSVEGFCCWSNRDVGRTASCREFEALSTTCCKPAINGALAASGLPCTI